MEKVVGMVAVGQASQWLNVHPNTLRRYEASGLIKAYRGPLPGSHRRFRPEDVVALAVEQAKVK